PIISAGYPKTLDVTHPDLPVGDWQHVELQTGMFRQVKHPDTGQVFWEKYRGLAGAPIPAGTRQTIGLMRIKDYKGKDVLFPLQVTAPEQADLYAEELEIALPEEFEADTGYGISKVSAYYNKETAVSSNVILNDLIKTNPQLNINLFGQGPTPSILFHARMTVGAAEKSISGYKQVTSEVPFLTDWNKTNPQPPIIELAGGIKKQVYYVTGEGKMDLQTFIYGQFGGIPNVNQLKMLELMNVEKPGLGTYLQQKVQEYWKGLPTEPQKDIPLESLPAWYDEFIGKPSTTRPTSINYFFDRMRARVEARPLQETLSTFGYGVQKEPIWNPVTNVSESEKLLIEQVATQTRHTAATGGRDIVKFIERGVGPDGTKQYELQELAKGYYGTVVSGIAPEFLASRTRLSVEDMMAADALSPTVAEALNISLSQHPSGTGLEPQFVRGWRALADVNRVNKQTGPRAPYTGFSAGDEPFKTIDVSQLPQEALNILAKADNKFGVALTTELRDAEGKPLLEPSESAKMLEEFEKLTGHAELLTNIKAGNMVFPLSPTLRKVSKYEFEPEMEMERQALSSLTRQWAYAAADFAMEPNPSSSTFYGKFMGHLNAIMGSKAINKQLTSKFVEGRSGRYYYASGLPLNVSVIPEIQAQQFLFGMAEKLDIPSEGRKEWIKKTYEQIGNEGGFPSYYFRSPNTQREYGVLAELAMTPTMLKRKHGVYIPEETIVQGMYKVRIAAGSPWTTGYVGGIGLVATQADADWDADQVAETIALAKEDFDVVKGYMVRDDIKKLVNKGAQETIDTIQAAMEAGHGPAGADKYNVISLMLNDLEDNLQGKKGIMTGGTYYPPAESIMGVGVLRRQSKGGMGVAFNIRRWLEASASSGVLGTGQINQGIIGMLSSYQDYLDYAIKEIEKQGGYSQMETMFSSIMFTYNPKRGMVELIAKPHPQSGFVRLWGDQPLKNREGEVSGGGSPWERFTRNVAESVAAAKWTTKTMAFALATKAEDIPVLIERIDRLGAGALFEHGGPYFREGYDIRESAVGRALIDAAIARSAGTFGRPEKEVEFETPTGKKKLPVFTAIGTAPYVTPKGETV
ncbi:hypothetical protein MUP59_10735, partial [Candidatus Bathyarchaeota archaeon]|nr:hypothetical protein [Candidatus Bathyarchaeota archaeon]